jgi:hypothetical protein
LFTLENLGNKKATWDNKKSFKNSRRNLKSLKSLNSSPEALRKRRIHRNTKKLNS